MGLTLLRHTTPEVAPGTCYGRTDLPLPTSFDTEARAVLRELSGGLPEDAPRPPALVTSPLMRCQRLARRLASHWQVPLTVAPLWTEMDFGRWEGVAWGTIPRGELDAWAADFHHYKGHGGESVAELEARIRTALDTTPPGAVVVTHAGAIKAVCAIHGLRDGWNSKVGFGQSLRM